MLVKISISGATEGPDSVARNLDMLKTEGNEDDGRTKSNAEGKMQECKPESVNEEPNDISYKLHSISSKENFF